MPNPGRVQKQMKEGDRRRTQKINLNLLQNFAKSTSKIVTNAMLECEASADDFAMYPVKNGDSFNVRTSITSSLLNVQKVIF